jgi:hypothetical protein
MKFIAKHKVHIFSITFTFILFLLFNKLLVLNLSTALSDWFDYPLMVYIMKQNIQHISTLDFSNFGNISMYHPTPDGMYFTDLLLPQSLLGLFIFPFTNNYITTHNIVFLIVGLLNIISLQYFWSKVFKDNRTIFLLTLLFTFSPYTFTMYAHYQMISYWFFFFSLGKLIEAKNSKDYFIAGTLSGLQFLAAVYIGIYSITISAIFFFWKYIENINIKDVFNKNISNIIKSITQPKRNINILKTGTLFLFGFIIIAGYFVFKFAEVQKTYNITRSSDVYVNHSMQISDFLFNPLPSFWVENFYSRINSYNQRRGGETFGSGFILLIVALYGGFKLKHSKLNNKEKSIFGFIIVLLIWGIIAIFGPRLAINGNYLGIPLPYIFPLKLTPFFKALRVVSRWFFVVQIALLYFVGVAINSIISKYKLGISFTIIGLVLILYSLEIVPIRQRTAVDTYKNSSYIFLVNNCKNDDVLLEYPFVPEQPNTHVLVTLNYWAKMLLNNMHYDCQLVNGYSGFQPKHIDDFVHNFRTSIEYSDSENIVKLINQKNIKYIKFNKDLMEPKTIKIIELEFNEKNSKVILNNSFYLILRIK